MLSKNARMTRATKPKPFPGKYPTRIAYAGMLLDGTHISYIGKPTRKVLARYQQWMRTHMLKQIWIIEFDRNGVIARDKSTNIYARACDTVQLRSSYHPFPKDANKFFHNGGEWRSLLHGTGRLAATAKRSIVFWPDDIPFINEMCNDLGYTIPADQVQVDRMFTIDLEQVPVAEPPVAAPTPPAWNPANAFTIDLEQVPANTMPTYERYMAQRLEAVQRQQQEQPAQPGRTVGYRFRYNTLEPFDGNWGGGGNNNGQ
jgi:hypothetical protein